MFKREFYIWYTLYVIYKILYGYMCLFRTRRLYERLRGLSYETAYPSKTWNFCVQYMRQIGIISWICVLLSFISMKERGGIYICSLVMSIGDIFINILMIADGFWSHNYFTFNISLLSVGLVLSTILIIQEYVL